MGCTPSIEIQSASKNESVPTSKTFTIYGASWCPWSRKLVREFENADAATWDVVWCDRRGPCPNIESFPTIDIANGTRVIGYVPRAELNALASK